jgi:hypothetical protein
VVRDERHVLAAEPPACDREVACRAGQRPRGVEALVHTRAGPAQRRGPADAAAPLGACELLRVAPAGGQIHAHAEQVGRGLGEDLRQPDRALEAARRARVHAPGALQEHERLERVGVHAGLLGGAFDGRTPEIGALGARHHAARRERVQGVAVAGRGTARELAGPLRIPRERIGQRLDVFPGLARRRRDEHHPGRWCVVAGEHARDRGGEHHDGGRQDDESTHRS